MHDHEFAIENFARNLRALCSRKPSVSHVCRDIGINRQQFDRYLRAKALPSANTMRRICEYFGIDEEALRDSPDQLRLRIDSFAPMLETPLERALRPEPGEMAHLSNYTGLYHYFFLSPSWPGKIQCGLTSISNVDGEIRSRYLGRVWDPDFRKIIRSRFTGRVVLRGDRIFILEHSSRLADSFGQTILYAAHQHRSNYITGMCFGIDWPPQRAPFCSPVIMKRISSTRDLREEVRACGLYDLDSRLLDPTVRNTFGDMSHPYRHLPTRPRTGRHSG